MAASLQKFWHPIRRGNRKTSYWDLIPWRNTSATSIISARWLAGLPDASKTVQLTLQARAVNLAGMQTAIISTAALADSIQWFGTLRHLKSRRAQVWTLHT